MKLLKTSFLALFFTLMNQTGFSQSALVTEGLRKCSISWPKPVTVCVGAKRMRNEPDYSKAVSQYRYICGTGAVERCYVPTFCDEHAHHGYSWGDCVNTFKRY